MSQATPALVNGLLFKLTYFDFIYMLGEFLSAISELHVKIQLVERYCPKILHNLRLLHKRGAPDGEIQEFFRRENHELVTGLLRQNIFYDKYRLKLTRIFHEGTEGELFVEDQYGGSQYVVPVKRVIDKLFEHRFDSTPVQEMRLFDQERAVMRVTSAFDESPGESANRVLVELEQAARNVHLYVKKEKLAGVVYVNSKHFVTDPRLIARAESQETEKQRFLKDAVIQALAQRMEAKTL